MGHDQEEFEQKKKKQIADANSDKELSELRAKAEKWDKLGEEIAKYYTNSNGDYDEENPEEDGDLCSIGEVAATAFGWI
jgi:hypothetical protein